MRHLLCSSFFPMFDKKVSIMYLNSPTRKCSSYIVANRCILIKEKKYVFVPKEIIRVV